MLFFFLSLRLIYLMPGELDAIWRIPTGGKKIEIFKN